MAGAFATYQAAPLQRRSVLKGANTLPPSPFATSGAQLTPYSTDSNLRGQTILPSDSARTTTASGQADNAYSNYANYQLPQFQTMNAYASKNSMDGIGPMTSNNVAGPDFGSARSAMMGGMPRASDYAQQAGDALGGVGGVSYSDNGATAALGKGFAYEGDTMGLRGNLVQRLSNLSAPDRVKLATEAFGQLEEGSRPQYEQAQRQVGQKAAALGRVGSGVTTNELGDLALQREKNLNLTKRGLATEAAGAQLQDQLDQAGAVSGGLSQLGGMDTGAEGLRMQRASLLKSIGDSQMSAQGQNASLGMQRASMLRQMGQDAWGQGLDVADREGSFARDTYGANVGNEERRQGVETRNVGLAQDKARFNESRDQYGYESGVNERNAGWNASKDRGTFLGQQASALGAREGQQRGFDASNRDELRGERGYQNDMANKAQSDRIAQQQFAQWLQTQNINNATGLYGAGQTGNPGGAYNAQAQNYGQQADGMFNTAGSIAQMLPYLRNRGAQSGGLPTLSMGF